MQSYTLYRASEFLRDRHPYIPEPNPRPLYDPEQVAIAYNERAVPKLADLLIYEQLSPESRRDALHTLNELVSHQETKCDMITNKITLHATNLMVDENPEVRFEAAYLVGSLLFLDVGRLQFDSFDGNYTIMQTLIFDKETKVRESVGWLLYRLSMHKEGTKMMNKSKTIYKIVDAFNFYATPSTINENIYYLLYLLEAMINLSRYDYNIDHMLKKGLLKSFNSVLEDKDQEYSNQLSKGHYQQLRELVLSTCKNITLIVNGKEEAFKENLIITGAKYLNSELEKERLYTSSMFMSITNILGSKKQISSYENTVNGVVHYVILEKICVLLEDKNEDIIASMEYGLYAKEMGGGSVNPLNGEFNFAVNEGYIVRNGKICEPVRGASLVGKGSQVIMDIDMVGKNLDMGQGMCGSSSGSVPTNVGQPMIRVSSITVGGR